MQGDSGRKSKALVVPLNEEEQQELRRILLDRDEAAALGFLHQHLRPALHKALHGGLKGHLDQSTAD
jgi:hypothetical protein